MMEEMEAVDLLVSRGVLSKAEGYDLIHRLLLGEKPEPPLQKVGRKVSRGLSARVGKKKISKRLPVERVQIPSKELRNASFFCPYCNSPHTGTHGSLSVTKKHGFVQKFKCHDCKRCFSKRGIDPEGKKGMDKLKKWTKEDDKFIVDNHDSMSLKGIAEKLDRDESSVKTRIYDLKTLGKIGVSA